MTNFPPSDDPGADHPSSPDDDGSVADDLTHSPIDDATGISDDALGALSTDEHRAEQPAASAISDDELLAAANASLHDEGDMTNAAPDSAGPDPTPGPHAPDAGPGPTDGAAGQDAPSQGAVGQPPPPAPGTPVYGTAPPIRRIYRSRHDRKLGGVSGGIAEFFRIDATLVRLATLIAAITGVGILVYIAAWFIIPLQPDGYVEPPRTTPIANERTMSLAFGIGALALAFGIVTGSWAILAIALIGGGIWLLSEHTATTPNFAGASPVAGTANYQSSGAFEPPYQPAVPGGPGAYTAAPSPAGYMAVPPVPPYVEPVAPKEHKPQRITWIVLSLLALLSAVGLAAATGDWWDVSATRLLGIGVVIIGVGVVTGQLRRGGARGLIPLGILAALALFPVSAVDGLLDNGVGEATYRPTTIAELDRTYEHGIGQLIVDLSELDFEGRTESIDIDLGIGELIVIVSEDTGGQAVLQAKAGEVSHYLPRTNSVLFEEGVNIETGTVVLEGENGSLDLNINVGLGTAELRSESN